MGSGRPNVRVTNFDSSGNDLDIAMEEAIEATLGTDTIQAATEAAIASKLLGTGQVAPGSLGFYLIKQFNRPNDTISYSAGDWVSNSTSSGSCFSFPLSDFPSNAAMPNVYRMMSMYLQLYINMTAVPSGMGNFQLWTESGNVGANDNTAFNIPFIYQCPVGRGAPAILGTPQAAGNQFLYSSLSSIGFPFSNLTDFNMYLRTVNAWTPEANTTFCLHAFGYFL